MSDLTIEMMEQLSSKYAKMILRDIKKLDEDVTPSDKEKTTEAVYEVLKKIIANKL